MFLGMFRHTVDAKGRVAIPAVFRRDLVQGCVITVGSEGRLVIRPPQEWNELQMQFRLRSDTQSDERRFMRYLYANAREAEMDAQGRLLLSPEQRQFARIADRAIFVGMGNVVEVVGESVWESEMNGFGPDLFTALNDRVNRPGTADSLEESP